jgi:hypothetical protein
MNAVVIMRALLLAHDPVVAMVADGVFAGDVPQDAKLPAIGIREISRVEQDVVSRDVPSVLVRARVQVTVYTTSYPQQKALLNAAKLSAGTHTGTIAGVEVCSVLRDAVGPDMGDATAGIFEQSRDFMVTYVEPN